MREELGQQQKIEKGMRWTGEKKWKQNSYFGKAVEKVKNIL